MHVRKRGNGLGAVGGESKRWRLRASTCIYKSLIYHVSARDPPGLTAFQMLITSSSSLHGCLLASACKIALQMLRTLIMYLAQNVVDKINILSL